MKKPSKAKAAAHKRRAEIEGQETDGEPSPSSTPDGSRRVPRVAAPYVPFPLDALPAKLGNFVFEVSDVMGCDPALVLMPCLAIAGGIVGNARSIQLKRTWRESPIIWAVSVADSSSTKSPAFRLVEAPLVALQLKINNSFGQKRDIFISDCTIEHVGTVLQGNPRGTLLAMDELTSWFGSFTRYRKTGSDAANWCQLWQCGTYKKDRATADTPNILVPEACCSVTGTITPGNLASVFSTPGLFETGLLFRMVYAMPPGRNEPWHEREVKPATMAYWAHRCETLLNLEGRHCLLPCEEAKKLWVEYFDSTSKKIDMAPFLVRAALVKLRAYTARFALLHFLLGCHEVDNGVGTIPVESMAAGIRLAQWFADEADRVYMLRGESEESRDLRSLADSIGKREGGRVTPSQLVQSNRRRFPTVDVAMNVLEVLVAEGYGEIIREGKSTIFVRGGIEPPTPVDGDPQQQPETPLAESEPAETTPDELPQIVPAEDAAPSSFSDGVPSVAMPEPPIDSRLRAIPVANLDIPIETRNLLIRAKLRTLGDLLDVDGTHANTAEAIGARIPELAGQPAVRVVVAIDTALYASSPTCSMCGRNIGLDARERTTCYECQQTTEGADPSADWRAVTIGERIKSALKINLLQRIEIFTLGDLADALDADRDLGLKSAEYEQLRGLIDDARNNPAATIPFAPPTEPPRGRKRRAQVQ